MDIENLQEYINLTTALVAAISAAIPAAIAIYKHFREGQVVAALHQTQVAIGEGGTVNDVVERIAALHNKVIETELPRSGATIISASGKEGA